METTMLPERCQFHEDSLKELRAEQSKMIRMQGVTDGKVDVIMRHFKLDPDSVPPPGSVSVETKYGKLRGPGPIVLLLAVIAMVGFFIERIVG